MTDKRKIVGSFEEVAFPELGITSVIAKVDTGAYSGALHCTDMKIVRRGKSKRRVLKFTPMGDASLAQETSNFKETFVRSASGHRQKRMIITTKIICGGIEYTTKIGLSNRRVMKREVLLGRRFLRENGILVDVTRNTKFDEERNL